MKWLLMLDDYDGILGYAIKDLSKTLPKLEALRTALADSFSLSMVFGYDSPGDFLNEYGKARSLRAYDKFAIVYDGDKLLAGAANDADYAMVYPSSKTLTHFTMGTADYSMKTPLKSAAATKFIGETIQRLYLKFCWDFSLPTDGISLEAKRTLIRGAGAEWSAYTTITGEKT